MKKKLTIGFALLLAACGSAKLATPTQTDVERVKGKYPGYTLAQLNEGKVLFETNCNLCHGLKDPQSRTEEEWKEIVPRMVAKVNRKDGHHLNDDDQTKILRYVVTMSTAPDKK